MAVSAGKIKVLFVAVFMMIKGSSAIDCYVCRGCATVTPADVQTCPGTSTDPPEPTTDFDGYFEQPSAAKRAGAAWLGDSDAKLIEDEGFVVDRSALAPLPFETRALKATDGSRCVVAVFEENGATNVVRECSTASSSQEQRCREAVGNSYTGPLTFCLLCDGDLCNSAPKAAAAIVILVIGLVINLV